MKKILLLFLLSVTPLLHAQTNGITYQAVIYKPIGDANPGVNNTNVPLALKNVCLQFTIVDNSNQSEYVENINTQTDKFGMVNLLIGSGNQVDGYASSFNNINWNTTIKSLVVRLDISGNCSNFEEISNQPFSVVPFSYNSFNATNATNITGVVTIENGGTNGTTILEAKTNLGLDQVENTSDLNKPISTATQNALNTKENSSNKSTDATLADATNTKFPTELAVKTYVDGQVVSVTNNTTTAMAAVQADVDANEAAANAAIALKEDAINKSTDATLADATNTKFPTELAVKTYVDGQVTSIGNNFLPLAGGTLTGQLFTPSVVFNNGSTWEIGNSGFNFSIYQGGCCSRVIIDENGNFGIGGNYLPQFKLDVEGSGRFTNSVTANAFSIPGGLASQFLKADGTVDSNSYFITNSSNVAIGYVSGSGGQGEHSIAIGSNTAQGPQAEGAVAVGYAAAQYNQGLNAVAVGSFAGNNNQPENAVAIGYNAQTNGTNAIAIGANAYAQNPNTVQIGDSNITNVNTYGSITANAEISAEITNNFTINATNAELYKGKVLICNPSSQITITFENNLPVGFNCMVLQKSDDANKINFAGGSGVTLKNRNNYTATAGNYAIATIVNIGGGIIVTAGDMQ